MMFPGYQLGAVAMYMMQGFCLTLFYRIVLDAVGTHQVEGHVRVTWCFVICILYMSGFKMSLIS